MICRQCQRDPDEYDRALRRLADQRDQLADRVADLEATVEAAETTHDDEEDAHQDTLSLLELRTQERDASLAGMAELEGKLATSERYSKHTEQWYAVRIERIKDVAKEVGIWPQIAAILANGTASSDDPVNYARLLNRAKHEAERANERAEDAEAKNAALQARVADLEEQVRAIDGLYQTEAAADRNRRAIFHEELDAGQGAIARVAELEAGIDTASDMLRGAMESRDEWIAAAHRAQRERDGWIATAHRAHRERDAASARVIALEEQIISLEVKLDDRKEALADIADGIDEPSLQPDGLGAGLEDLGITDRYEAAEYGWRECYRDTQRWIKSILAPCFPPSGDDVVSE